MKVVRLSALHARRLYSPGHILGSHFCQMLGRLQDPCAAGTIVSDTTGNRIGDLSLNQLRHRLPLCSIGTGTITVGTVVGAVVDHSSSSGAEVKNEWKFTCPPPICLNAL